MENEFNEETIIEPQETNETEVVEESPIEETQEEIPQEVTEEKPQETPEAKYARLKRQTEQLEKKYGFQPKPKAQQAETVQTGLSSKDTIALINAKVHEDDVADVLDYAKYKKISVAEALKSGVIKASLTEKDELRTTAQATNTGKTRSGSSKVSGDTLLSKAQKTGEIPDSDEGMDALLKARYGK